MKVDLDDIERLLRGLSILASYTPTPAGLSQLLAYAAVLVKLGDEALTRRKVLLAKLSVWITEKRGPNTQELDSMQAQRDLLDQELAMLEMQILQETRSPTP